jgi:hypothetical protein
MHSGSEQRTEGLSLRLPVPSNRAEFQPGRRMTRGPSTRPAAEMPSQTRYNRLMCFRPYRRRQRAQRRTFPSPNLPCRRTLPSPDFPCWETLRSSNLPWRPAASTKRMVHPASARRRTSLGSRLALRVRSHPGELQSARPAHLECRAETSGQVAGGGGAQGRLRIGRAAAQENRRRRDRQACHHGFDLIYLGIPGTPPSEASCQKNNHTARTSLWLNC